MVKMARRGEDGQERSMSSLFQAEWCWAKFNSVDWGHLVVKRKYYSASIGKVVSIAAFVKLAGGKNMLRLWL